MSHEELFELAKSFVGDNELAITSWMNGFKECEKRMKEKIEAIYDSFAKN